MRRIKSKAQQGQLKLNYHGIKFNADEITSEVTFT